ncbi:hypothetical protein SGHV137 [Glossina pallidipes salivary gland hypertrophy virus]|uniref:Uncharacterized protein n=1 Tax=Glossina hytrovirus (isolate Glossina pallidipes/Ethiopia/Seibersdorf/-) TaxID=379529 RepID=B0YLU1_GHVS|nr:hypothetical protein SGHV137 [Glossina pallidipes salivary gland hypertrophy virus]ABQ08910.1 hypothetical protein SGHV137 [Glossina pallidipes salivary gland hypertrophy virus]
MDQPINYHNLFLTYINNNSQKNIICSQCSSVIKLMNIIKHLAENHEIYVTETSSLYNLKQCYFCYFQKFQNGADFVHLYKCAIKKVNEAK